MLQLDESLVVFKLMYNSFLLATNICSRGTNIVTLYNYTLKKLLAVALRLMIPKCCDKTMRFSHQFT